MAITILLLYPIHRVQRWRAILEEL